MAVVTVAAIGVAASAASAAVSFKQAAEQKRLAKEADDAAAKAMREAKSRAEVDHYEGLGVPLDAYEAEFESNLAVQKQNVEALQEGDARALAAGVGKIGAQSAAAAEETRMAMGDEISNLEKMKADSKENINQQLIEMDVAAAKEQNIRHREASAARAAAISSGIAATGSAISGLGEMAPLFGKSKADRRGSKIAETYSGDAPIDKNTGKPMSAEAWAGMQGEYWAGKDKQHYKDVKGGGYKWDINTNAWVPK